jgi:hypothetical protein
MVKIPGLPSHPFRIEIARSRLFSQPPAAGTKPLIIYHFFKGLTKRACLIGVV